MHRSVPLDPFRAGAAHVMQLRPVTRRDEPAHYSPINHKMYMAPHSPERSPRAVTLAMSLDKSKERVRPECEIALPCKEVIRAWGRAAACDKALLFMRARRRDDGRFEDPSFVLDEPRFRKSRHSRHRP